MKRSGTVFLVLFVLLTGFRSYAGVICGGSAGSELWCEQTATTYETMNWEEFIWNVTAYSPVTVSFTAAETAPDGGCSWEVWADTGGPGGWMGNFILYPGDVYTSYTENNEVYPGTIGMWGIAWDATVNMSITWGWPN